MAWQPQSSPSVGSETWTAREQELVAQARATAQREQEAAEHARDCRAFATFCDRKAEAARERNHRGDEQAAVVWDAAADNIEKGLWTIHPTIRSEPAITRFASLQTRLNYLAKNVQLKD